MKKIVAIACALMLSATAGAAFAQRSEEEQERADLQTLHGKITDCFAGNPASWKAGDGNIVYAVGRVWSPIPNGWRLREDMHQNVRSTATELMEACNTPVRGWAARLGLGFVRDVARTLDQVGGGSSGRIVFDASNPNANKRLECYQIVKRVYGQLMDMTRPEPMKVAGEAGGSMRAKSTKTRKKVRQTGLLGVGPGGR